MKYAQWGDVVFEVLSYRSHNEEFDFVYAKHETIKPPSSLQWMGNRDLRKIKIGLRFHAQWCNPEEEYRKFLEEAEKGEAKKLILAEKVMGDFVVEKISSTIQQIDAWGKAVIIDVDADFTEYVEKKTETRQIKAKKPGSKSIKKPLAKAQKPQVAEKIVTRETNKDGYTTTKIVDKK